MTQVEFEKQLNGMKADYHRELEAIEKWQVELKRDIAEKTKQRTDVEGAISRMKAEKRGLAARRMEIQQKWQRRIEQFKNDNYSEERRLESVSDFTLVKELAKRGWHGPIWNEREDMADTHKDDVVKTFNATYSEQNSDNPSS
jgi:hypothetical protein